MDEIRIDFPVTIRRGGYWPLSSFRSKFITKRAVRPSIIRADDIPIEDRA